MAWEIKEEAGRWEQWRDEQDEDEQRMIESFKARQKKTL